jgi:hypothetical protein
LKWVPARQFIQSPSNIRFLRNSIFILRLLAIGFLWQEAPCSFLNRPERRIHLRKYTTITEINQMHNSGFIKVHLLKKRFLMILAFGSASYLCMAQGISDTTSPKNNHQTIVRRAPWFVERFKIAAGLFVPINNTNIQVSNTSGNIGTDINFESDLGFKRSLGTILADFQWRSSRRSRFDLSFCIVDRNSTYTLKKDITFGNDVYHLNTSVNAFVNTNIYRFSYGYAVLEEPKYEAGLMIGTHIVTADVGMGINGANINATVHDAFNVTAPLPDLGIWGGYAFSPRWAVNAEFGYLGLTVDNITGRILEANAVVIFKIIRNLDVALGYTGLNFKVNATKEKFSGNLMWGYNGPSLTAMFSFGHRPWTH